MTQDTVNKISRVFIVDDEESIRDSLMEFLEDSGFVTHTAGNAEDALARADLGEMDVLIVDIRLPHMDGASFIKAAYRRNPGLNFLIHTGSMDFQLDDELRSIGLCERDVLLKPVVDMDDFVRSITRIVSASNNVQRVGSA